MASTPTYLDCNATTPLDPRVQEAVLLAMARPGNAGSRTHVYGTEAKRSALQARERLAKALGSRVEDLIITSGATEADNLAILGLVTHGELSGRRHLLASTIEHKAVLEPLQQLAKRGFTVELLPVSQGGRVEPEQLRERLRPDTLLVSVMQANNETGVLQPLDEIAAVLRGHEAYFHVDAAQGFGKCQLGLSNPRIDLISVSAHKLFAPMGIGALALRRRGFDRPPLAPLLFGGGQERGLRPGTLPMPLLVGFATACTLAESEREEWIKTNQRIRSEALAALTPLGIACNGDQEHCLPHVLNLSVLGVDSEAAMVALKEIIACSNGSACTSERHEPSHVLTAMGLPESRIRSALRLSWCHLTGPVAWDRVATILARLRR